MIYIVRTLNGQKNIKSKSFSFKQLGVYGLIKEMVLLCSKISQTSLEIAESGDMLRFVGNGIPVKLMLSPCEIIGVDTPEDHEKAIS